MSSGTSYVDEYYFNFLYMHLCFPAEFQQQDGSEELGFPTMIRSLIRPYYKLWNVCEF